MDKPKAPKKPKEPQKINTTFLENITYPSNYETETISFGSLKNSIDKFCEKNKIADPDNVNISFNVDVTQSDYEYSNESEIFLAYTREINVSEYEERMKKYTDDLKDYNKKYEEYKKKRKEYDKKKKEQDRLKEIETIRKRLKELENGA